MRVPGYSSERERGGHDGGFLSIIYYLNRIIRSKSSCELGFEETSAYSFQEAEARTLAMELGNLCLTAFNIYHLLPLADEPKQKHSRVGTADLITWR